MKNFIVVFSKALPWIYLVLGIVYVFTNTPKNEFGDENGVLAIMMLVGVVLSTLFLVGISYVIEASVKYLQKN